MFGMTVGNLKELLEDLDDNMEIRFASQPSWPFEYSIEELVTAKIRNDRTGEKEEIAYLVEGQQLGYLPGKAAAAAGWAEDDEEDPEDEELDLDEDFRMLAKTYPADVSAIGVTALIDYVEALEAELARRDEELKITDGLLKEATETIGAVIACCTYNSNDDAKIGIYGIDQKAFTRIDQFITHYNDAVSAGKVSIDVKRDLSDAEIEELGARAAESKQFCPNCEAETPCTHEAELYVCDICGEDFAKYIVSRNCNVSDVSVTQNVLTDVKTGQSVEIETCSWIQEDDPEICYWKTRCGNSFYFTEGTPADNRMKYCCYCGKLLKQED